MPEPEAFFSSSMVARFVRARHILTDTDTITMPTLEEAVRERIRATYVELLPDDEWQQLVQHEIAWFLHPLRTIDAAGHPPAASPLQAVIRAELQRRFAEQLRAELDKSAYQEVFEWLFGAAMQQAMSTARRAVETLPVRD